MSYSIVIPSKNAVNLTACVNAIWKASETARIIVIDDGLEKQREGSNYIVGSRPFIYARNCNLGILAAGDDDVILLNDDAMLKTSYGFSVMAEAAQLNPDYGIIGATTWHTGNVNQWPRDTRMPLTVPNFAPGITPYPEPQEPGLREDPRMVCFVCVYIPRRTIDLVGMLDERFVDYGYEDGDYCVRVRQAGLKIGIHDGCFVDHGSLTSTFRGSATAGGKLEPNMHRFIEKWGSLDL